LDLDFEKRVPCAYDLYSHVGGVLFPALVVSTTTHTPGNSTASTLVLSVPGAALSFEQIDEHSRKLEDGSFAAETRKSKIYRDSSGRLRIESSTPATYIIQLIDPIAGSRVILLSTETGKIGYRLPWPKSSEVKFTFHSPVGNENAGEPPRNWTSTTENLGTRTIEDIEFEGLRIVSAAEDEPELKKTHEHWYSADQKLIGLIVSSSADETYKARIQSVRREEPDSSLFAIPPDYTVLDHLPLSD
jgi:hypothetical protein